MGDSIAWQERERLKIHIQTLSGLCQQMATGCLPSPLCLYWHRVASQLGSKSRDRGLLWEQSHYWAVVHLSGLTAHPLPQLPPGVSVPLHNKRGESAGDIHAVTTRGLTNTTHTWVSPTLPHPRHRSPLYQQPTCLPALAAKWIFELFASRIWITKPFCVTAAANEFCFYSSNS